MSRRTDLLHPGPPPLTRQAVQGAIDVIDFMAAVVRGVDLIDVTPDVRRRWQAHVLAYYPMLPPGDRQFLATGDTMLATLQANWPQLPSQQREMYRQLWSQSLPGVLRFAEPVIGAAASSGAGGGYNAYAPQPTAGAGPNTYGAGAPSGYVAEILAQQKAAEARAYQEGGPMAGQQVAGQNEAVNVAMLSNMSQMAYKSAMAVANNMKY